MLLSVARIELRNFMTHRQETVDFPASGVILFWGPSGAGKSTIMEAVGFALYGLNATRAASLEELRHELYPDEDFGVRVSFRMGDGTLQIFRGVEGGKTVVWMVDADGTMTEGPRPVAAQIDELMGGMDAATFFATYVSQQGELDAMVKMAGGGRRKFVQRMLGITLLDKVTTRINRELVSASDRIKFLDETLPAQSKKELLAALHEGEQRQAELAAQAAAVAEELEAVKVQGEGLAGRLKQAEAQGARALELTPKLESLQETTLPALHKELAALQGGLEGAQAAAARIAEGSATLQEIERLQQRVEALSGAEGALAALQDAQRAHQRALEAVQGLQEGVSGAQQPPEALEGEKRALEDRAAALRASQLELQERVQGLEGQEDCWVCGQHLPDPQALRRDLQEHQQRAAQELEAVERQIREISVRLDSARALHDAQQQEQAAAARLDELQGQAAGADAAQLQADRRRLQELAEVRAGLETDRVLAASQPELQRQQQQVTGKLEQAQGQLQEWQQELQGLGFDAQLLQELRQETDAARGRYMELRDQLAALREQGQAAGAATQLARAAAEQYDATVADRAKAEERHALLKRLDGSMKEFKGFMVGQIRPTLQTLTSKHLSALTDGAMSGVEIDEEYNLSIHQEDGSRRIGMCSGGEQARAAFALRLALTQLVASRTDTPVGFMVFDEIFGSQDEAHRRAILESLVYLRGVLPQVFLISHESSLRESDLVDVIVDVPEGGAAGRIQVSSR